MQVSHSLETASEVSILSSPLCRDKNELLSSLKIFVGRMRNLRVLRVDEEFTRLIFDGKAASRSDLRELCAEICFKGVILIGAAPDLDEWNSSVSNILQHTMDRDCLLHLFSVYMEMAELHPDIPWKIPNLAAYSFTEETIRNFHRQNISEPHIDESFSDEEESSEDTVSFITEDVQYDTEMDELEKAEFQLASDGSIDDDFDGGSDESDEAEEEEYSESNGSPLEEVGDEEYEELEEEDESYSHNSFIDSEAEEEQEVEEHESDQDSQGNSDSNEEGVLDGMFDESALESTSDEDVELADLVMNPQKRVVRRKIIISESDGDC